MPSQVDEEEQQERRKRALLLLRRIQRRVNQVCGRVDKADNFLQEIQKIVDDLRELAEDTGTYQLVPTDVRDQLGDLADRFADVAEVVGQVDDVCDRARELLQNTEQYLKDETPRPTQRETEAPRSPNRLRQAVAVIGAIIAIVVLVIVFVPSGSDDGLSIGEPDTSDDPAPSLPETPVFNPPDTVVDEDPGPIVN